MRILLVGNNFSNYENVLENELKSLGDFVDRLSYSSFLPNRFKFQSNFLSLLFYIISSILSFPSRIIISTKIILSLKRYDIILCINGSFLVYKIIRISKYSNKICIWIMDPLAKFPRTLKLKSLCTIFCYSEFDSRVYKLRFLPLFSALSREDKSIIANDDGGPHKKFYIAFIGAIDLYRLFMLEELVRRSLLSSKPLFIGGVFGKLSQAERLFRKSNYFINLKSLFHFRRFSFKEIYEIYSASEYVFNYNVGDHSGASMRFFEALELQLEQLCDYEVVRSRYCSFILKVRQSSITLGFPAYKSYLEPSDVKIAVSARNRLLHLKRVYLRQI
jgi:hypothetical protein